MQPEAHKDPKIRCSIGSKIRVILKGKQNEEGVNEAEKNKIKEKRLPGETLEILLAKGLG